MHTQMHQEQVEFFGKLEEPQFHFGAVRSPIQCQGIERGHRRTAAVGAYGSVNPQQFGNGSSLGLLSNILPIANLF